MPRDRPMKIQPIQRFGRSKSHSARPMRMVTPTKEIVYRAKTFLRFISRLLSDAELEVLPVHQPRVHRDLDDEHDERPLRGDVVAEREPEDDDPVQLAGEEPAEDVRDQEPYDEEHHGESDVVLPVTLTLLGRELRLRHRHDSSTSEH